MGRQGDKETRGQGDKKKFKLLTPNSGGTNSYLLLAIKLLPTPYSLNLKLK